MIPAETQVTMRRYVVAISAISTLSVCVRIKAPAKKNPITKNRTKLQKARRTAEFAALSERSKRFSPSDLDRIALTPTPVPELTAIIRFCSGNASVTAVSACSLSRATKMLSTTL